MWLSVDSFAFFFLIKIGLMPLRSASRWSVDASRSPVLLQVFFSYKSQS